ncbi:MAG: sulfotransferase domain-containing protein [Magnetococcales bacterium]|nr:sulfotransferase domain-containing protein [Magnetococcales bacterium]
MPTSTSCSPSFERAVSRPLTDGNQSLQQTPPRVIVISHERSGTHFLMNSLAASYGYVAKPWINFDSDQFNINYFHPPRVARFFQQFSSYPLSQIIKSHHHVDFFAGVLEEITQSFIILYIHRDPRGVMPSFWRFNNQLAWREGPQTETCQQFIRAQPGGRLLRYQINQQKSMVHRWQSHVSGWVSAARHNPHIQLVSYEKLRDDYRGVMEELSPLLQHQPTAFTPPDKLTNVVSPNTGYQPQCQFGEVDEAFFQECAGDLLAKLGYGLPSDR